MDVFQLIVAIVGFLVAIGSIWYTAHLNKRTGVLLASHQASMDKELTEFKHDLESNSNLAFERFRSGLEIQMAENRWIREKRFEIIRDLYAQISDTLYLAESVVAPRTGDWVPFLGGLLDVAKAESKADGFITIATSLATFRKSYMRDRIILGDETCQVIDKVQLEAMKLLATAYTSLMQEGHDRKNEQHVQVVELMVHLSSELVSQFKIGLQAFEEEARRVLPNGV